MFHFSRFNRLSDFPGEPLTRRKSDHFTVNSPSVSVYQPSYNHGYSKASVTHSRCCATRLVMQTPPESTACNTHTHLRKALDFKQQRKVYINLLAFTVDIVRKHTAVLIVTLCSVVQVFWPDSWERNACRVNDRSNWTT